MAPTTPVEIVTTFLRAFERFEFDVMPAFMDDDVQLLLPTAPAGIERELIGREAFTAFLHQVKLVWKDFKIVRFDVNAFEDSETRVLAEYTSEGTNVDGTPYRNTYATLVEVVDGKITVFQEFFDPAPLANAIQILAAASQSA
jgi:ketosteroid isomerase-like protein